MSSRNTSVAGTFYPDSCNEVNRYINHFNETLDDSDMQLDLDIIPRALISPHAGYVYSGFTANIAFKVAAKAVTPKKVIVIGPSHRAFINGASVALNDRYITPCGELNIDKEFSQKLIDNFTFLNYLPGAHAEHSTEVQMPFIKHYFPKVQVVEIVYGKIDFNDIAKVIDELLKDKDNLIVISTDLSHFYTQEEAEVLDNICLNAIANLDLPSFDNGCEACGIIGVKAVVKAATKNSLNSKVLDYRTSYDASGDDTRVVGYVSAIIG